MASDTHIDARRGGDTAEDPDLYPQSQSPQASDNDDQQRHRRGYQACERCRSRKVKCDLGSVDAPHSPPCARCRREAKPCEFATTRKKRKTSHRLDLDDFVETDKRRRTLSNDQDTSPTYPALDSSSNFGTKDWHAQQHLPNLLPQPRSEPVQPYSTSHQYDQPVRKTPLPNVVPNKNSNGEVQLRSAAAESTLSRALASTHDNLLVLYNAANATSPDISTPGTDHDLGRVRSISNAMTGGTPLNLDQALSPAQKQDREQALQAWRRMRFVRAGWFTAEEAMAYVEYFFARLQLMTPVIVSQFRAPGMHLTLLSEEPILALTILAIASRHMKVQGHARLSRSYLIHDQLWSYLQSMVQRLLWGQEQFGGGFCGGGTATIHESPGGQLTWKGSLRTLGTVEALLLLNDWQPRALHFPPGDDENRLLDVNYDLLPDSNNTGGGTYTNTNQTQDHVPYGSWLEPAWRSDRMSWMLLGLAQALSVELGVFEDNKSARKGRQPLVPDSVRKQRLKSLLLVYVAQTSGRMCVASPLKISDWEDEYKYDTVGSVSYAYATADKTDTMLKLWVRIAGIMDKANREIFPSKQFTRELTSTGEYKRSIAVFTKLIDEWKRYYESVKTGIHKVMQYILLMEYEYARLYINSLGLQNVVDSWVTQGSHMQKSTMVKIADDNKKYIDALTDAALHILEMVVNGLGSTEYLRDGPVRVYLRVLSAMMFTLKRLSLGNHEKMVRRSLDLLDRTTMVLAREVVDDVHLSSQTARLVQLIVNHVKQTLIRVQKPNSSSGVQSRDQSRAVSPQQRTEGHMNFNTNMDQFAAGVANPGHNTSMNDPIAGIQAKPMADLLEQTFMPPPNFNFQTNDLDTNYMDDSIDPGSLSDGLADWLTLPLDNLWNDGMTSVDQGLGGLGPTVGTRDMLEVITNKDYNQLLWNGTTSPYQGFNGL